MMRDTKAVSPPGVTISLGLPVQALLGGRDFSRAEAEREAAEG